MYSPLIQVSKFLGLSLRYESGFNWNILVVCFGISHAMLLLDFSIKDQGLLPSNSGVCVCIHTIYDPEFLFMRPNKAKLRFLRRRRNLVFFLVTNLVPFLATNLASKLFSVVGTSFGTQNDFDVGRILAPNLVPILIHFLGTRAYD